MSKSQLNLEQRAAIDGVFAYADSEMARGIVPGVVAANLAEMGLDEHSASIVVRQLARARGIGGQDEPRQGMRPAVRIAVGLGLLFLGILFTAASYSARQSGGQFYFYWGLMLVGLVMVFRGISEWR